MRYNETNSKQIGNTNIVDDILDDNSIIEVSAQVMSDIYGKLQANYDLVVYGNIEVESLIVMGNLVCFGNCKAVSMNVQGRCDIFGTLEVREALLSDELRARELIIEDLEVTGKVICDSIECQGKLKAHSTVLVSEGIMGEGTYDCVLVICGEYAFTEMNSNVVVAAEIEEKIVEIQAQDETFLEEEIGEMDWHQCEDYLQLLSHKKPEVYQQYETYLELYKWSELTKLKSINQYIQLADLLNLEGEEYRKADLYQVIKVELFDKAVTYIFDAEIESLSQEKFAELNYKLYKNRSIIPNDVYEFIREKMYYKIGLKYNTVVLMLGE